LAAQLSVVRVGSGEPDLKNLNGKRAIVTGAASGIGRAIALGLASQGCHLFLVDRDKQRLSVVAAEAAQNVEAAQNKVNGGEAIDVNEVCVDLSRPDQVSLVTTSVIERWGGLDILINNAGICYYGSSLSMNGEQWDRILAVNLSAPMQLTRELLPYLLDKQESHIVNVASMYGLFATPKCTAYHATKFGLVGFSEALRAEFHRYGLGVTALCPGFVESNLFSSMQITSEQRKSRPPRFLCTSAEAVARRAVRAIKKNKRMVVVTPVAHFGYFMKRLSPGLMAMLASFGRKKRFVLADQRQHLLRFPTRDSASLESKTAADANLKKSA